MHGRFCFSGRLIEDPAQFFTEWLRETDVRNNAFREEGINAVARAVDDLVGNHQISRR